MNERTLTDTEAARALGVGRDATREEITAAFRRAIADSHPDRGGRDDAARLIVDARDALLDRRPVEPMQAQPSGARRQRTFFRCRRFAWR
jgi:curved DNA-binding protein CbpA